MQRLGSSFFISLLLHVGLFALAFITWTHKDAIVLTSSVPVQIITDMPSFERAASPVDELAVKPPEPEPAPEVPPEPAPPTPEPKQPVPKPEIAKPSPKPLPKTPEVSKDGLKKPQTKPAPKALDLDALTKMQSAPSKATTKAPAKASPKPTDGASNAGAAAADTGPALNALTSRLQRLWNPACDVPGANQVEVDISFTVSASGRVIKGPEWVDKRSDPVWEASAGRAMQAVKRGELYSGLPEKLYNQPLIITFDAKSACKLR